MSFRPDHELHKRRFGRNAGVGIILVLFAAMIYGLTVVKAGQTYVPPQSQTEGQP